jgi:hypothetical protein
MNFEDWVDENPLKKWMRGNRVTQVEVASFCGRSNYTIYSWIRGITPARDVDAFWDLIEELTENPSIKDEWAEWLKHRPKPGADDE